MICGEMKEKIGDFLFHFTTNHGKRALFLLTQAQ